MPERGCTVRMTQSTRRIRARSAPHRTALRLIDTTVELLDTIPADMLTLSDVLGASGISHGSLYHHFEDFNDLIEQAVAQRFSQHLRQSVQGIQALVDGSQDGAAFRAGAEMMMREVHRPERHPNRLQRATTLSMAQGRPRLQVAIAKAQQEVTDATAELLTEAQRRGWTRPDADMTTVAVLLQALTLGRLVDDIAERHVDPESWETLAVGLSMSALFGDPVS